MSAADRVFRALGISLVGSVLSWLTCFGIVFLVDDARHHVASIGIGGVHASGGGFWIAFPIILSAVSIIVGFMTSFG